MSFLWCRVDLNFRNRQKRFDDFLNCKVFFSQITGFTDGRVIIVRSWAWPEGWVVGTSLKPEWRTPDGHVHVDVCPQRQNFVQSLRENLCINIVMRFASVIIPASVILKLDKKMQMYLTHRMISTLPDDTGFAIHEVKLIKIGFYDNINITLWTSGDKII